MARLYEDKLKFLTGKRVAVVGLGINNRHLAEFLSSQGVPYEVIEGWQSTTALTGKLNKFDVIFRTPGLPYLSEAVQAAIRQGTVVSSQTKLFFDLCRCPIIGITGTKGKGTTAALLSKILNDSGRKTWLAGNVGKDPFEFLEQISKDDYVVYELSSFQLQDLEQSPHIAVVLDITADHLNHHQTFEEYQEAKTSILRFQTADDYAVLSPNLPVEFKTLGQGQKILFDSEQVSDYQTKLLGRHNLTNLAASREVAKILKVSEEEIRKSVAEFEALDHRLKVIGEVNGIMFIDDAYSTNAGPVMAAVEATAALGKPTILILGGFDKGVDFSEAAARIEAAKHIKTLVVIGQVTAKILPLLAAFRGKIVTGAKNMQDLISQASAEAQSGDVVLFSPGTSSFDMFKNETDRGEQFVKGVQAL